VDAKVSYAAAKRTKAEAGDHHDDTEF